MKTVHLNGYYKDLVVRAIKTKTVFYLTQHLSHLGHTTEDDTKSEEKTMFTWLPSNKSLPFS